MGRKALPKKRKEDTSGKTKEWLHALFVHCQEHGLKGLTMDDMAGVLGKSKTTVYEYFPTREVLLAQMISVKLAEIGTVSQILTNRKSGYLERYFEVLQHLALHVSGISTIFLADLKTLFPELWQQIEVLLDQVIGLLEEFYREGIENGQFNDIHPAILTQGDRLFFRTLANPDFLASSGLSIQEAFEQYLRLKFFGLIRRENSAL